MDDFSKLVHTTNLQGFPLIGRLPVTFSNTSRLNALQSSMIVHWMPTGRKALSKGIGSIRCLFGNAKRLFKLFWICSSKGSSQECSELLTVGILPTRDCDQQSRSLNNRERGNFSIYKLGEFVHYRSKVTFTIAFYFRTNIKYSRYVSTTLSVGIRWASNLFETLTCSRITLQIYGNHKLGMVSITLPIRQQQIHDNF